MVKNVCKPFKKRIARRLFDSDPVNKSTRRTYDFRAHTGTNTANIKSRLFDGMAVKTSPAKVLFELFATALHPFSIY